MKKSYILKFDEIQGDYVIVEKTANEGEYKQDSQSSVFAWNLFKNTKKSLKNQQNVEKSKENAEKHGYIYGLDKEIEKRIEDRQSLTKGLIFMQNVKDLSVDILGEQTRQTPEMPFGPERTEPNIPIQPSISDPVDESTQENIEPAEPSQPEVPSVPVVPTPNANPSNSEVSVAEGIQLLAQLYGNFRILNMIYQNLRDINQSYAQNFSNFIVENVSLMGGILNIYYTVSNQQNLPRQTEEVPRLSDRFDDIVMTASSYVQGMREINLRLRRIFLVDSFTRQFELVESSLAIQNDFLTNLRLQNLGV